MFKAVTLGGYCRYLFSVHNFLVKKNV